MTRRGTAALASALFVLASAPAMAQSRMGSGGHSGGGAPGATHALTGDRSGAHFGQNGFGDRRRFGHGGHGDVFVYGYGWPYGFGYPWYAGPVDYGHEEPYASPPPPPSGYHYYDRHHDPNACAEWSWSQRRGRYLCTRHAF